MNKMKKIGKLEEELSICHTVIRAYEKMCKKQSEDIELLNKSLDIVTEERDKWKALAESRIAEWSGTLSFKELIADNKEEAKE